MSEKYRLSDVGASRGPKIIGTGGFISPEEIELRRAGLNEEANHARKRDVILEKVLELGQTQLIRPCQSDDKECLMRRPETICKANGGVNLAASTLSCPLGQGQITLLSKPANEIVK